MIRKSEPVLSCRHNTRHDSLWGYIIKKRRDMLMTTTPPPSLI